MRIKVVNAEKKYKLSPELITIQGIAEDGRMITASYFKDQIHNLPKDVSSIQRGSIMNLRALDRAELCD